MISKVVNPRLLGALAVTIYLVMLMQSSLLPEKAASYSVAKTAEFLPPVGAGQTDNPNTSTPVTAACELYPIALFHETLRSASPGDVIADIYNGVQPGNFGWLSWTGDQTAPVLARSLTPP